MRKKLKSDKMKMNFLNKRLFAILLLILAFIVLLFLSPWIIWQFYNARAKKQNASKAYNSYRAALYYLNQLGYKRDNLGPQEYALIIDKKFETTFGTFSNVYQKLKYSSILLTKSEEDIVASFYKPFRVQMHKQVAFKTRFSKFLNIYNTIHYFTQPKTS